MCKLKKVSQQCKKDKRVQKHEQSFCQRLIQECINLNYYKPKLQHYIVERFRKLQLGVVKQAIKFECDCKKTIHFSSCIFSTKFNAHTSLLMMQDEMRNWKGVSTIKELGREKNTQK